MKDTIIASKGFNTLVLDMEYPAEPRFNIDSCCICRVLCDGWMVCKIIASDRDAAIDKFLSGAYKEA